MKKEEIDFYVKMPFERRFALAEELREIYYRFHPPEKRGFYKSFSSWKEYLKWRKTRFS